MDLKTNYLGLELNSPIAVSASPLSREIDNIKMMEESGAGAVVLFSLFEEQIMLEAHEALDHEFAGTAISAESMSFFPSVDEYRSGTDEYLGIISDTKQATSFPVIASLNGSTEGGWTDYAKKFEDAGADAVELNLYNIPSDPDQTAEEVESRYLSVVKTVKDSVNIPVAVKLSPFFTNMANFAKKVDALGVNGMVLFNRFYQPDINLETKEVEPSVLLSHSSAMRIPMRWIAMLSGSINADFGATSGIHTGEDVVKAMMAGAKAAFMCSALLKNGISHIKTAEAELKAWMEANEYNSVAEMQGAMSQKNIQDPGVFERAQYMKALSTYVVPNM